MRYARYVLAPLGAVIATVFIWEAAYALSVAWFAHNWALWTRFTHGFELLLPLQSATTEWGNPVVNRLIGRANLGAMLVVVLVSAAISQIYQSLRGIAPPKGGSRIATVNDLKKANLLNGRRGYSIFLGRIGGRDVRYSGHSHIYVNGPTRSGKGVGFVLPNAIEWRGSFVGFDIKREMWAAVGAARAGLGQPVYLFSPGSPESHCWNPLDLVAPWPTRGTDVSNIARSLIGPPASGDAYWTDTARGLFAGLLAYVLDSETMKDRRTIKSVLSMLTRGKPLAAVMAEILEKEGDLNEFVRDSFRLHMGREEKQRMHFESHIITALEPWKNQLVDQATSRSDFNIADLRRAPFTILIGTPVGTFASSESVVRLLIQQVHDVLLRQLPDPDEPHRLLLMLDEFYQFGKMPEIVDRAPVVAAYGFQIAMIAQGLTQLDVRYGRPTRDMLIGNMDVKLLIGVGDETTAKYCADEMGKHYVRREGWGTSIGGGSFVGGAPRSSRTTQGRWELEPLMPSEALRRFDPKQSILLVRDQYPAVVDKVNFFLDPYFQRIVAAAKNFKHLLSAPPVGSGALNAQWASPTLAAADPSAAVKHEQFLAGIMALASDVFLDPSAFRVAFVQSMSERSNDAVAELCQRLRLEPEFFGELTKRPGSWPKAVAPLVRAWERIQKRQTPEVFTAKLRSAIVAARRSLNNDRMAQSGSVGVEAVAAATTAKGRIELALITQGTPPTTAASLAPGVDQLAAGGGEPLDMVKVMAKIAEESDALLCEAKDAVIGAVGIADRSMVGEAIFRITTNHELFQNTPDDLYAHLQSP